MSGLFLNNQLTKHTSFLGLRLWVVLALSVGASIVISLFLISLCVTSKRKNTTTDSSSKLEAFRKTKTIPFASTEIRVDPSRPNPKPGQTHVQNPDPLFAGVEEKSLDNGKIQIEIGKDHHRPITYPKSGVEVAVAVDVSHLGWGECYTMREVEEATNGFADENVIGEGGYGIVYSGVFQDNTQVAVKNLLNNKGQAEREFKVEVEAIGRVRHKNLVRLLGYCAEGAHRMLVYEYVDNGNLEHWLHGEVGPCSPLTWGVRMKIVLGTAKGLAYLHEGLEPKVVHRDIKSSNILLDRQWNAKVSDFGLAKLLGSDMSYVTTRVMGTFGYVAPEYANTGKLNERSDVYSFGILLMEIISGRNPVDYSRPQGEEKLVEWLKAMVSDRNAEGILDPKLPEKPSSRALKRALLVALRCVDPNAQKRPKMGHVIHMLEADDFPFRDQDRTRASRDQGWSSQQSGGVKNRLTEKHGAVESGDSSGYESNALTSRKVWRQQELEEEHKLIESTA